MLTSSPSLLQRLEARVPRYTSYPTAPHFSADIGAAQYRDWLAALGQSPAQSPAHSPAHSPAVSLYLHVPFCNQLCWYCGCHTTVVGTYAPIADFADLLLREIDLVGAALEAGGRRSASHLHFGGGTPTVLSPEDLERIFAALGRYFDLSAAEEIAIEIDPRRVDADRIRTLGRLGFTRASLGVQDFDPDVQRAINRLQTVDRTAEVVGMLRGVGIGAINLDLMYGLPHQTVAKVLNTVDLALAMQPQRVALFGYAHVPWMKKHQQLIDEAHLPGAAERFDQAEAAAERLVAAGFVRIGFDHFARPDDPMAKAQADGRLQRNFQGYTTDAAPAMLGFGPSAIGYLPQGYLQNAAATPAWRQAILNGTLPIARGYALSDDDRLRRAAIGRLLCDMTVDLAAVAQGFGAGPDYFDADLAGMEDLEADGLVQIDGRRITMRAEARPFVRLAAAALDAYLVSAPKTYSKAV